MDFGIRIENQNGNLLVGQDYYNYVVMQEGSASRGRLTYTGTMDASNLVFVHPNMAGDGNYLFSYGSTAGGFLAGENFWFPQPGSYASVSGFSRGGTMTFGYVTASNLNIYPAPADDGFAFAVYDEKSYKAFDSRYPYLEVVGVYYVGTGRPADIYLPSPPPGKRYYFLLNHMTMTSSEIYRYSGGSADEETFGRALMKISDTHFRVLYGAFMELNELAGSGTSRRLDPDHTICMMVIVR